MSTTPRRTRRARAMAIATLQRRKSTGTPTERQTLGKQSSRARRLPGPLASLRRRVCEIVAIGRLQLYRFFLINDEGRSLALAVAGCDDSGHSTRRSRAASVTVGKVPDSTAIDKAGSNILSKKLYAKTREKKNLHQT